MNRIGFTMGVALVVGHAYWPSGAEAQLTEWRLDGPQVEIGRSDVDLYEVSAASPLQDGTLAIADRGNARILVVSESGRALRAFGRAGDGPGEFRYLKDVRAFGDTLMAGYSRGVSTWLSDGTLIADRSTPSYDGLSVDFVAALTSSRWIGATRTSVESAASGLYDRYRDLVVVDHVTNEVTPLAPFLWNRVYQHIATDGAVPGARTGYTTPFLGETLVTSTRGRIVVVPLDSEAVQVIDPHEGETSHIPLDLRVRPFDEQS